jgi:hypothetical protein
MVRSISSSAPLPAPLSTIRATRDLPMIVAADGSGLWMRKVCSPCNSLTQSIPVPGCFAQNPGQPGTLANVGDTRRFFS